MRTSKYNIFCHGCSMTKPVTRSSGAHENQLALKSLLVHSVRMDRPTTHRRSRLRKYRKRLVTLLAVMGLLCLTIGGLIELAALMQMEH